MKSLHFFIFFFLSAVTLEQPNLIFESIPSSLLQSYQLSKLLTGNKPNDLSHIHSSQMNDGIESNSPGKVNGLRNNSQSFFLTSSPETETPGSVGGQKPGASATGVLFL
jgi:hypothetical protein